MKAKKFYFLFCLYAYESLAEGNIDISAVMKEGESKYSELGMLANLFKTGQEILYYGVSPLIGVGLMTSGLKEIAVAIRGERASGVIKIICGIACFALIPIVKMGLKFIQS